MPVRVKYRANRFASSHEIEKEFSRIKYAVVAVLLASLKDVGVCLTVANSRLKLEYRPSQLNHGFAEQDQYRASSFKPRRMCSILHEADLVKDMNTTPWKVASVRANHTRIRAFISTTPSPSKHCQFMSFGQEPISSSTDMFGLYNLVNSTFGQSTFGSSRDNPENSIKVSRVLSSAQKMKTVDKWPMFYIRIDTSFDTISEAFPATHASGYMKQIRQIRNVLKLLMQQFLSQNGFQSRPKQRSTGVPLRSRSLFPDNTRSNFFSGWPRLKGGSHLNPNEFQPKISFCKSAERGQPSSLSEDVQILLNDIEMDESEDQVASLELLISDDVFTGNSANSISKQNDWNDNDPCPCFNAQGNQLCYYDTDNGFELPNTTNCKQDHNKTKQLQSVFADSNYRENTKSNTRTSSMNLPRLGPNFHKLRIQNNAAVQKSFDSSNRFEEIKIHTSNLKEAIVIGQIDNKFILVVVPPNESVYPLTSSGGKDILLLIDQHAADERVKVEELYQQICTSKPLTLSEPIIFYISQEESLMFSRYRDYFSAWNINYDILNSTTKCTTTEIEFDYESSLKLSVNAVPTLVAERCRLQPKILIELLREEIWSSPSDRNPLRECLSPSEVNSENWILKLGRCPSRLVEIVNSRACRSAIMFNDPLDRKACSELVGRLANCVFPFQCAHGRPSMTVLAQLSEVCMSETRDSGLKVISGSDQSSFAKAWTSWSQSN